MRTCILAFMIGLLFLPAISAAAESDTLFLEGVGIKIGAPKSEVRAKFTEGYTIAEQNENWDIFTKERFLGTIQFENGCVKTIVKNWSDYRVKFGGQKSFQTLFDLMSNLTKQGFVVAQVSTKEIKQRNFTSNIIRLKMNNRTIDISVQKAVDGEGYAVHIDEILSK
ncbi:MAG TPA: hypothetical protein VFG09_09370 [Thermodesulfovibrionales bacterium]|nr:hypothetical protein [Thermodesulfovibrionales bacterium]